MAMPSTLRGATRPHLDVGPVEGVAVVGDEDVRPLLAHDREEGLEERALALNI
jgi:hypothetical protein